MTHARCLRGWPLLAIIVAGVWACSRGTLLGNRDHAQSSDGSAGDGHGVSDADGDGGGNIGSDTADPSDTGVSPTATIIDVRSSNAQDADHSAPKTLDRVFTDDSYWAVEGDGEWISYELDRVVTVSYVRLAFYLDTQRYFDVQYSIDSTTWLNTSAFGLTSAPEMANQYQRFDFVPVSARYVRIVGHGSSAPSLWFSIVETDVNGFPVSLPSPPTQYCGDGSCNNGETCSTCAGDCGNCQTNDAFNIFFVQDFEDDTLGDYLESERQTDWSSAGGARPSEKVRIESESGNKLMKNYFDAGLFGLSESGIDWYMNLSDQTQTELYVSFDVKFSDNMATESPYPEHWMSGKTMGIYTNMNGWDGAGNKPVPEDKAFFLLIMFDGAYPRDSMPHDKLRMKFYVYHLDMTCPAPPPDCWGNSFPIEYYFSPDTWYVVTARVALNNPGVADGVLELFVNRQLAGSFNSFRFRDASDVRIQMFNVANFLGGSGTVPTVDGWWAYDDFVIYNYKAGLSGIPYNTTPSQAGRVLELPVIE